MDSVLSWTWHQVQNHTALSLEVYPGFLWSIGIKMNFPPESRRAHILLYRVQGWEVMLNHSELRGDQFLTVLGVWFTLISSLSLARILNAPAAFKTVTLKERTWFHLPLVCSTELQFEVDLWPGAAPGHTPFKHETRDSRRYLYICVPSSTLDTSQEVEATQMPTHRWWISKYMVDAYDRMCFGLQIQRTDTLQHRWKSRGHETTNTAWFCCFRSPRVHTHRGRQSRGGGLCLENIINE